ncbi:pheromone A receptor-domain-containing protein [Gloeopeniophorella convolvens]|nr:pheromone A receptor-domain-containing protein [Gloeopeniophorella convolvens]
MAGPPNELFSAFALVGFLVCAIPFYWHFRARNTGTCLYMFWAGFGCFLHFVNSIIWNKNMINRAPVYCDIVTRIQAGLAVSIPASALCITRKLYKVTKATSARPTREEIRRSTIVDLMIGPGLPILQMALEYVVEGHRYDLFEDFGPFLFVLDTPPAYPLVAVWPLAIGIVSLVYDVLNIFHLWKRGRHLKQMLAKQQGWSPNLYYRLIALSIVDIVVTIPICSYLIWADVTGGNMYKWKSWSDTHADYSKVVQYANVIWKNNPPVHLTLELYRWLFVASALVFFVFFGFADEAREHYRLVYRWFVRRACRLLSLPEPIDQKTYAYSLFLQAHPCLSRAQPPHTTHVVHRQLHAPGDDAAHHQGHRLREARPGPAHLPPPVAPARR